MSDGVEGVSLGVDDRGDAFGGEHAVGVGFVSEGEKEMAGERTRGGLSILLWRVSGLSLHMTNMTQPVRQFIESSTADVNGKNKGEG